MKNGQFIGERYLEYRLEKSDGQFDEDEIGVYFERDTGDSVLENKLFFTFGRWNDLLKYVGTPSFDDQVTSLIYNQVEIVFNTSSTDCASLSNPLSKTYQEAEIKIKCDVMTYFNDHNRLVLSQLSNIFSGVGQIMLFYFDGNERTLKGKYFFAINEMARLRIDYYFEKSSGGVIAHLKCKNRGCRLALNLLENRYRLPCLMGDKANTVGEKQIVDFSSGEEQTLTFRCLSDAYHVLNFADEKDEKYYLLNLLYDDNFDAICLGKSEPVRGTYTCPYCGEKMRERRVVRAYETGAVCCSVNDPSLLSPKIYKKDGSQASQVLYCKQDLEIMNNRMVFNPGFMRLLPAHFYDNIECKIALLGSVRAGKTTFLSRFFGLTASSNQVAMNLRHLSNAMSKLNISVTPASCPALSAQEVGVYQTLDYNYFANAKFYADRAIDLATGAFPMATPSGVDCSRYPFILEVKGNSGQNAYINFYDIPGEDARNKKLKATVAGECSGIFLFINAIRDVEGNASIIHSLKAANLPSDTPIAIILAKSDLVESKFLSSAHILRTDYYDFDKNIDYEKGLGREILASSIEVKSYLQAESMILELEQQYKNISYFALSTFNFSNAIHGPNESPNDPGHLRFEDGTKRMELPFIWMLKQFGLLK